MAIFCRDAMLPIVINPSTERVREKSGKEAFIWVHGGEMQEPLLRLHHRYTGRARAVHSGRNRNVMELSDKWVVKLPSNPCGFTDNDWEGSVSNSPQFIGSDFHVQYARTRMAYWEGIPVVFMEQVQPLTTEEIVARFGYEPDWVGSVDCGQVGVNRQGRLVAYDYGLC